MELLKNLELVEVSIKDGKATMVFLDEERGEVREVNFNKNVYDRDKNTWVESEEKAEKVEQWCQEHFKLSFDDLGKAVGARKDIYAYDRFNSLWEVEQINKFDKDMVGQILTATITSIEDDGQGIRIKFEYDGNTYESKMNYSDYIEARGEWFLNRQKQKRQYERFEKKFHVPIKEKDKLVGKEIMVEVKLAFGKFITNDIKDLPKPKK